MVVLKGTERKGGGDLNKTKSRKIGDVTYIVKCSYDENNSVKDAFESMIINDFLNSLNSPKDGGSVDIISNIPYNMSDVKAAV